MKRGTPQHPKMAMLASELSIARYAAVGLLESLWHWAAQYAKDGDIGRYPVAVIASVLGWEGDAEVLLAALIKCRWVDVHTACAQEAHAVGRQVVRYLHDWHEHAEDAVHLSLARATERFANGAIPNMARLAKDEKSRLTKLYEQSTQNAHGVPTPCARCGHCLSLSLSHSLSKENNSGPEVKAESTPDATADHAHGDTLDQKIRDFIGRHPAINYSPRAHADVRKMVETGSWDEMTSAIDVAVTNNADDPPSYARRVLASNKTKEQLKRGNGESAGNGRSVTKAVVKGER